MVAVGRPGNILFGKDFVDAFAYLPFSLAFSQTLLD